MATATLPAHGVINLGGNYDAVQQADGTWTIKGVPIFAELPAGVRGNKDAIDGEWMRLAVHRAKQLFAERNQPTDQEGYRAPLHVRHHGGAIETEYAGKIELTDVRRIVYQGKPVYAIFADLVKVPDTVYNRIRTGELAYRSVEVAKPGWEHPEIASCSLLPDEAPFFKFSPTTIRYETGASLETAPAATITGSAPALAFRGVSDGGMILFSFRGGYQMAEDEKKDEKPEEKKGEDEKGEKKELAGGAEEKKPAGEPVEAENVKDYSRKAYKALKMMLPILHAMAGKMGVQLNPVAVGEEKGPKADDDKGPYEQPDPEKKKEGANMAEESGVKLAELTAKLSAVEQRVDKREAADKTAAMVAGAKVQLKGYTVSEDIEKRLFEFAAAGQPMLDSFVSTFKAVAVKDPPATLADYESGNGGSLQFPEAVMKFSAQGPEVLEKAKKHFRDWDRLGKNRPVGLTMERFIEMELAHAE